MKSWWRSVISYPPTWIAAVVLGATVWLVLTVLDPPGVLVVILIVLALVAAVAWPFTMSATGTLAKLQFEVPRVEEVDPAEIAAPAPGLSCRSAPNSTLRRCCGVSPMASATARESSTTSLQCSPV